MDSESLNEGAAIKTENKGKGQAIGREGWETSKWREHSEAFQAGRNLAFSRNWKKIDVDGVQGR